MCMMVYNVLIIIQKADKKSYINDVRRLATIIATMPHQVRGSSKHTGRFVVKILFIVKGCT